MHLVIGLGEIGKPLYQILNETFPGKVQGHDEKLLMEPYGIFKYLHICIPYSKTFVKTVKAYQKTHKVEITIIHSTVPIGTTDRIPNAVHSPINGQHTHIYEQLKNFPKWIGGKLAKKVSGIFEAANILTVCVNSAKETELLKLTCLAKYGVSIAFAQYQSNLCKRYGINYEDVLNWDRYYNLSVRNKKQRPIIIPPGKQIGGHCVIPVTKLLNKQHPNQMLKEVLKYE